MTKETKYKDFVFKWFNKQKHFIKPSTAESYKWIINNKLNYFYDYKLKDINNLIIQDYILESTDATSSIKQYVRVFKTTLMYLFNNDIIDRFKIDIKYKKCSTEKKIKFLLKEEYSKLLDFVTSDKKVDNKGYDHKLSCLLGIHSGLRVGEISALTWNDIDLENKEINVSKTATYINGKMIIGTPKSETSNRKVPLTSTLYEYISNIKVRRKTHYCITSSKDIPQPRTLRNGFKKIQDKLYFKNYYNFHCLRHTFASNCILNDVDVKTTSELIGHSDTSTTLRIYTHTDNEHKRNALDIINKL